MAITAAGVGSGLDIEGIVSSLMQLERRPLDLLEEREAEYRAELSAYGRLKSAISSFQDAMDGLGSIDKFKIFGATSSDEDVATVTADSAAAQGTVDLEITRLAQNHKMAADQSFADTATFDGTLDFTVGSDTLNLSFSGASLEEIRDAINEDENNPGVSATILNEDGGNQRLILTATESGYDARVQATSGLTQGGTAVDFSTINKDETGATIGETELDKLNASFTVDGFAVTRGSNRVDDVLDGLTFELQSVGSANLQVDRDTDAIKESVQGFVDAFNELYDLTETLEAGNLAGDSTLRNLQNQLRDVINTAPTGLSGAFTYLSEVGIATERDGRLSLDSGDLEDALSTDFAGVAELFANDDQGYAFRFADYADSLLDSNGLIDAREDGLNERIRDLEDKQLNYEYQLELKEKHLRSQYAALDSLVGSLQQTSNFLYQQLGA